MGGPCGVFVVLNNMSYDSLMKLALMPTPPRQPQADLAPRKSPRQARATATVQAILEAAAHILETQGLAACSTNAVARKAGVSIGSLYQYFPSRDAITKALILEQAAAIVVKVEAIATSQGGRVALRRLVGIAIEQQLFRPKLARVLDLEEQRLPTESDLQGYASRLYAAMQTFLAQPDMPASAQQPEVAADLLAIIRGMVDAAGGRGESDVAELRVRVERAVFGYVYAEG
jgi:AcrR family transcriptional regulator